MLSDKEAEQNNKNRNSLINSTKRLAPISKNVEGWQTYEQDLQEFYNTFNIKPSSALLEPDSVYKWINGANFGAFIILLYNNSELDPVTASKQYLNITKIQFQNFMLRNRELQKLLWAVIRQRELTDSKSIFLNAYKGIPEEIKEEVTNNITGETFERISANGLKYYDNKIKHKEKIIHMLSDNENLIESDDIQSRLGGVKRESKSLALQFLSKTTEDINDTLAGELG